MLTNEAFEVLALKRGATPAEIKEAYRDLVKVWHPDRFGSDARLRQKAEDKLKRLNDAYQMLQSGGGNAPEAETARSRNGNASPVSTSTAPIPRSRNKNAQGPGWIFGFVGLVLGSVAGYLLLQHGSMQRAKATTASAQQVTDAGHKPALANSKRQTGTEVFGGPKVHPMQQPNQNVLPTDSGDSSRSGSPPYRIFSLSDDQRSQLESACLSQKKLNGTVAYEACVKVQLDSITNASSPPDLNGLGTAERESIESVCSEAKGSGELDAYNHCLNAQMAALAAEPLRPDLSKLSEADRTSIESACRNTKNREGPSAYDRCLMRFIKLLAEARE